MSEEKLIDHSDGEKLAIDIWLGKTDTIACNVISLLKTILESLQELEERLQTLEGLVGV